MLSISHLIYFYVHLIRLISLTKAGQNLIDAMQESKRQFNQFLLSVNPSQYIDETKSKSDVDLLRQKVRVLNDLLDNKAPISPYSGKYILTALCVSTLRKLGT